jgi:hemolysin III
LHRRDGGDRSRRRAAAAERIADLAVLLVGLVLGSAGAAALVAAAAATGAADRVVAAIGIYAVALPTMFLCALLFSAALETAWRGFFRRLDHAAIFALIAATATPFAVTLPTGRGLALAAAVWVIAAVGIFVKLRYPIGRAYRSAAIFGLSGWSLMLALAPTIASQHALYPILLGGALYTFGIGFHLWRRLRFHRAIWHAFVIAGAMAHYLAVIRILG